MSATIHCLRPQRGHGTLPRVKRCRRGNAQLVEKRDRLAGACEAVVLAGTANNPTIMSTPTPAEPSPCPRCRYLMTPPICSECGCYAEYQLVPIGFRSVASWRLICTVAAVFCVCVLTVFSASRARLRYEAHVRSHLDSESNAMQAVSYLREANDWALNKTGEQLPRFRDQPNSIKLLTQRTTPVAVLSLGSEIARTLGLPRVLFTCGVIAATGLWLIYRIRQGLWVAAPTDTRSWLMLAALLFVIASLVFEL